MLRHYPEEGSRQDFAMATAGFLLKGGWGDTDVLEIVGDVATAAVDEEIPARIEAAKSTIVKFEAGDQVTGYQALKEVISVAAVERLAKLMPHHCTDSNPVPEAMTHLNSRHAVVMVGGKACILNESTDPISGHRLATFSSAADFKLRYLNKTVHVEDDAKPMSIATIWLHSAVRRQYEGIVLGHRNYPMIITTCLEGSPSNLYLGTAACTSATSET